MEDFMLELDSIFFRLLYVYMPIAGLFIFLWIRKELVHANGKYGLYTYLAMALIIFMSLYSLPFAYRYMGAF